MPRSVHPPHSSPRNRRSHAAGSGRGRRRAAEGGSDVLVSLTLMFPMRSPAGQQDGHPRDPIKLLRHQPCHPPPSFLSFHHAFSCHPTCGSKWVPKGGVLGAACAPPAGPGECIHCPSPDDRGLKNPVNNGAGCSGLGGATLLAAVPGPISPYQPWRKQCQQETAQAEISQQMLWSPPSAGILAWEPISGPTLLQQHISNSLCQTPAQQGAPDQVGCAGSPPFIAPL